MKAKYIYEFERGQEPFKAMEIGSEAAKDKEIKDWLKKNLDIENVNPINIIHYAVIGNRLDIIKHMMEVKHIKPTENALHAAITIGNEDIILYLLTDGNEKTTEYIKKHRKNQIHILINNGKS
jgi:ankyrin repeat protein